MVVPVPFVVGVPVTVVHIIDVVPMGHRHVSTSLAVLVRVVAVSGVPAGLTLVHMVVVDPVEVSVVGVVHVVPVRERDMAAAPIVLVHVVGMGGVCSSHEIPGCLSEPSSARTFCATGSILLSDEAYHSR